MTNVCEQLKALRLRDVPPLSLRRIAEELGVTHSRYVYFEDPKRFKKAALPIDLTRQIADVLQRYGVDPAEVMPLAGLSEDEAAPDVRKIEAQKPQMQIVPVGMAMPSEEALREMFRALLVIVPDGASKDEIAAILARRLPTGFAAIGPYWLDHAPNAEAIHPSPILAEDHSAKELPLHTQ